MQDTKGCYMETQYDKTIFWEKCVQFYLLQEVLALSICKYIFSICDFFCVSQTYLTKDICV